MFQKPAAIFNNCMLMLRHKQCRIAVTRQWEERRKQLVRLVKRVLLLKCPPLGRVCTHCSPRTSCSVLGCSRSATPQCRMILWWQLKAARLHSIFPYRLKQPGSNKTNNLEFSAHKEDSVLFPEMSLSVSLHVPGACFYSVVPGERLADPSHLKAVNLERCVVSLAAPAGGAP